MNIKNKGIALIELIIVVLLVSLMMSQSYTSFIKVENNLKANAETRALIGTQLLIQGLFIERNFFQEFDNSFLIDSKILPDAWKKVNGKIYNSYGGEVEVGANKKTLQAESPYVFISSKKVPPQACNQMVNFLHEYFYIISVNDIIIQSAEKRYSFNDTISACTQDENTLYFSFNKGIQHTKQ